MPLFYLHLFEGEADFPDEEGLNLPDVASARSAAIHGLRDTVAGFVMRGDLDTRCYIAVEDQDHREVERVGFADAVHII